jgi:hypothetical protein
MEFPAEMLIEYVRVYQRKGQPTSDAIRPTTLPRNTSIDTYSSTCCLLLACLVRLLTFLFVSCTLDPNLTAFNYPVSKNGLASTFLAPSIIIISRQTNPRRPDPPLLSLSVPRRLLISFSIYFNLMRTMALGRFFHVCIHK